MIGLPHLLRIDFSTIKKGEVNLNEENTSIDPMSPVRSFRNPQLSPLTRLWTPRLLARLTRRKMDEKKMADDIEGCWNDDEGRERQVKKARRRCSLCKKADETRRLLCFDKDRLTRKK